MKPLLTIAIPVYNRRPLLKRAIDSILCQMDERVEILISDNSSNDGTLEMMRDEYPNIRYSRNKENVGAEANFLKCCELAQGEFFLLFGSDDVFVEGSLSKILSFLKKNKNCSIVFLNHAFFHREYIDLNHCYKKWLDEFESLITVNKKEFIKYAKNQLSFMSCLIFSKEAYKTVLNPEQYIWTYFLHTNIALEFTKGDSPAFGIIGDICIADNITHGEASIDKDQKLYFKVFGKGMYYTFCKHAIECGYNKRQMRNIYKKAILKPFIVKVLELKCKGQTNWKESFWNDCYPAVKSFPFLSSTLIFTAILPKKTAIFLYNKFLPLKKI